MSFTLTAILSLLGTILSLVSFLAIPQWQNMCFGKSGSLICSLFARSSLLSLLPIYIKMNDFTLVALSLHITVNVNVLYLGLWMRGTLKMAYPCTSDFIFVFYILFCDFPEGEACIREVWASLYRSRRICDLLQGLPLTRGKHNAEYNEL